MISGWGSARRKGQAKKACKADVVRKLFHADLLPKYDGNCENLIRWIVASYRKYKAQEDLLVWPHTHSYWLAKPVLALLLQFRGPMTLSEGPVQRDLIEPLESGTFLKKDLMRGIKV